MKCAKCQTDNKDTAKSCRKCGINLQREPLWKPTWRWHARTLVIIYAGVLIAFFILRAMLKPYVRELPPEITPWMQKGPPADAAG